MRLVLLKQDLIPTSSLTLTRYSLRTALQIPIEDDSNEELDGIITVTISDPTNADDYQIGSASSAQVSVSDNDENTTPTITIADATAVVEGTDTNAVFTLTTSHTVRDARTINITISGATSFIQSGQIPTSVSFPSLSTSTELRIPIEDDDVEEADGAITVTLSAPTNANDYQIGSPSSAQVSVTDNDNVPRVKVVNYGRNYTEGTHSIVSVIFNSDREVLEDTVINILVQGATNYIPEGQIPTSVTMLANTSRVVLEVPIDDDDVVELDDRIHVTMLAPSNSDSYEFWTSRSTSFIVRDNDEPLETAPEISVSTISDYVIGTDGYLFRFTASHASTTDINITVGVLNMPYDHAFSRSEINRSIEVKSWDNCV